jgi:hypothetical protein
MMIDAVRFCETSVLQEPHDIPEDGILDSFLFGVLLG